MSTINNIDNPEGDILRKISALLSEESYCRLQLEIKRMKQDAPPASGTGINHIQYVPQNLTECQKQVRRLQERLNWRRQLCFLYEVVERKARQKIVILERESQKLREENKELKEELKS